MYDTSHTADFWKTPLHCQFYRLEHLCYSPHFWKSSPFDEVPKVEYQHECRVLCAGFVRGSGFAVAVGIPSREEPTRQTHSPKITERGEGTAHDLAGGGYSSRDGRYGFLEERQQTPRFRRTSPISPTVIPNVIDVYMHLNAFGRHGLGMASPTGNEDSFSFLHGGRRVLGGGYPRRLHGRGLQGRRRRTFPLPLPLNPLITSTIIN